VYPERLREIGFMDGRNVRLVGPSVSWLEDPGLGVVLVFHTKRLELRVARVHQGISWQIERREDGRRLEHSLHEPDGSCYGPSTLPQRFVELEEGGPLFLLAFNNYVCKCCQKHDFALHRMDNTLSEVPGSRASFDAYDTSLSVMHAAPWGWIYRPPEGGSGWYDVTGFGDDGARFWERTITFSIFSTMSPSWATKDRGTDAQWRQRCVYLKKSERVSCTKKLERRGVFPAVSSLLEGSECKVYETTCPFIEQVCSFWLGKHVARHERMLERRGVDIERGTARPPVGEVKTCVDTLQRQLERSSRARWTRGHVEGRR